VVDNQVMNEWDLSFKTTEDYLCLVDQDNPDYHRHYKCWHGGRAAGKSTQLARGALFRGLIQPLRILCTREYQNSISDSILTLLSDQIKILGLENFFDVQQKSIYGENGTEFIFKGLKINPDSIKSMEGIDLCLVMEAHTISEESWKILTPTIRVEGSEIWSEWNPKKDSDPTQQRFIKSKPPNSFKRLLVLSATGAFFQILPRCLYYVPLIVPHHSSIPPSHLTFSPE